MVASVIAMGEPLRALRSLNMPVGLALAIGSWYFGAPPAATLNAIVAGLAVVLLSIPRGQRRERYGTWDRFIF